MSRLSWLPLNTNEWINRTAFLSMAEAGALLVCVLASWNASVRGEEPGTLPASPDALARLLGADAATVMPLVRQHWTEDPDRPGRLRCAWLAELYAEQLRKHESIVARAKKGGWPKGRPRKSTAQPAPTAIPEVLLKPTHQEEDPVGGFSEAPTTGGGVAAVGRGGATATPPPTPARVPDDPVPVTVGEVAAWAEQVPELRSEIEAAVDAQLDEDNRGWRERPAGTAVRNRLVEARLAERFTRERRRGVLGIPGPIPHSTRSLPGAAYA